MLRRQVTFDSFELYFRSCQAHRGQQLSGLLTAIFVTVLLTGCEIHWEGLGAGGNGAWVRGGVMAPDGSFVIMGSDNGGRFLSNDKGATWTPINEELMRDGVPIQAYNTNAMELDRCAPDNIYIGTKGLYVSRDGGKNWSEKLGDRYETYAIAIAPPTKPGTAATDVYIGTKNGFIYHNTDAWETPTPSDVCPGKPGSTVFCQQLADCSSGHAPIVNDIVVNPLDATELLAATSCGLFASNSVPMSWSRVSNPSTDPEREVSRLKLSFAGDYCDPGAVDNNGPEPRLYALLNVRQAHSGLKSKCSEDVTRASALPPLRSLEDSVLISDDWGASWTAPGPAPGVATPGFEIVSGMTGWAATGGASESACGAPSGHCALISENTQRWTSTSLPLDADTVYEASVVAYVENTATSGGAVARMDINYNPPFCAARGKDNYILLKEVEQNGPDWVTYSTYFRTPTNVGGGGSVSAQIELFATDPSANTKFAGLEIIPSAGLLPKVSGNAAIPCITQYATLAVAPGDPDVAYVGTARHMVSGGLEGGQLGGVWRTANGGNSWALSTRRWDLESVNHPRAPIIANQYHAMLTVTAGRGLRAYFGDELFLYKRNPAVPFLSGPATNTWTEVTGSKTGGATWGPYSANGNTNNITIYSFATAEKAESVFGAGTGPRIYYGDADGYFLFSLNDGASFDTSGHDRHDPDYCEPTTYPDSWYTPAGPDIKGDSVTSIVLHNTDPSIVYVGVSSKDHDSSDNDGGVVRGQFSGGNWNWTRVGDGMGPLEKGGIQLALTTGGDALLAAVFGEGIARKDLTAPLEDPWNNLSTATWDGRGRPGPKKDNWQSYRLARSPTSDRVFLGFGDPRADSEYEGDTGIWMSTDFGDSWTRISATTCDVDIAPVQELVAVSDDVVLVGTGYQSVHASIDGGLWRGRRLTSGRCSSKCLSSPKSGGPRHNWCWTRTLDASFVTGIAVSPFNSDVVYAAASQQASTAWGSTNGAGIWESMNGGQSWRSVRNVGLHSLRQPRLFFSSNDPHTIFAATRGNGLFRGDIRTLARLKLP